MTNPTSIVIVDDNEAVRKGLIAYLRTLPVFEVVGEAASGEDALILVSELVPEVVLLDLIMPDLDGVEVTRRVKQMSPRTQVIMLTSNHEDVRILSALEAGAISYILKDVKMEWLAEILHRTIEGEVTLHPGIAARVLQGIRNEESNEQSVFPELTARELNVLKFIASGLTNRQIAEKLAISENTTMGHVINIIRKLHFTIAHIY
jgi:DNA-binding NarL/FixJ family response regulator